MKTWIRRALMLLCLAPAVFASDAEETSQSVLSETAESATEEATSVQGVDAEDTAPEEKPQRAWGGIFSSIIEFFGGETSESSVEAERESHPEAGPAPERDTDREHVPDDTPVLKPNPDPHGTADPEGAETPDRKDTEERDGAAGHEDQDEAAPPPVPEEDEDHGDAGIDHAYRATVDLLAEIELLRAAQGISDDPGEPETRENETSLRAYIKSREVMEKTARVQRRLGMIPIEAPPIPVRNIVPKDIHRNVQAVVEEARRVKRQLVIEEEIQSAPLGEGATLVFVYRNLEHASFLLDGLVGRPTTSNDVYMHVLQVQDEMASIAAHLGVVLEVEPPAVEGKKEPKEVVEQVLRAVYKTINLQFRLGMDASSVPDVALAQVTPADAFNATNTLLAELMRIKVHMDIQSPPAKRRYSRKKQPSDTFAEILLLLRHLDAVSRLPNRAISSPEIGGLKGG